MSKLLKKTKNADLKPSSVRSVKSRLADRPTLSKDEPMKYRLPFALTSRAIGYGFLLYGARLFTQAFRSPISSVLYVFLYLLPLSSLLYLLLCRCFVCVRKKETRVEGKKKMPMHADLRLVNRSVLPLGLMEADLLLPDEAFVRCRTKRVQLTLLPRSESNLLPPLCFPYRGEYSVGVSDVYLYDFFGLFRVRKRLASYLKICVLPRRRRGEIPQTASVGTAWEQGEGLWGIDRADMKDLRAYVPGDNVKTVHWNLSAKREELTVKDYFYHAGSTVRIFVDMAEVDGGKLTKKRLWKWQDDINEFVVDGVVEAVLSLIDFTLEHNHRCEVILFDGQDKESACRRYINDREDADRFFRTLAVASVVPSDLTVQKLAEALEFEEAAVCLFVSGHMDEGFPGEVRAAAEIAKCDRTALCFVDSEERILTEEGKTEYRRLLQRNRAHLQNSGIDFVFAHDLYADADVPT